MIDAQGPEAVLEELGPYSPTRTPELIGSMALRGAVILLDSLNAERQSEVMGLLDVRALTFADAAAILLLLGLAAVLTQVM
ncbi:MAG: hypothetical protein O2800_02155 [Planctomycetota bacterium]|nr:hypothetical protein [Planctomycetota bacterium]